MTLISNSAPSTLDNETELPPSPRAAGVHNTNSKLLLQALSETDPRTLDSYAHSLVQFFMHQVGLAVLFKWKEGCLY